MQAIMRHGFFFIIKQGMSVNEGLRFWHKHSPGFEFQRATILDHFPECHNNDSAEHCCIGLK